MTVSFELSQASENQFRFVLKADNGETILTSEPYLDKALALEGIAAVRANLSEASCYDRAFHASGKPYFRLKDADGRILGTSPLYEVVTSREAVITTTMLESSDVEIKDLS